MTYLISTLVNEWSRDGQELIRTFARIVFIVNVREIFCSQQIAQGHG